MSRVRIGIILASNGVRAWVVPSPTRATSTPLTFLAPLAVLYFECTMLLCSFEETRY